MQRSSAATPCAPRQAMPLPDLVLASSSVNRAQLLARLGLPFVCQSPDVDETPRRGERAEELVCRLAMDKANAVAVRHPEALVIASDQIATLNGELFGKPGTVPEARRQLRAMSGQSVRFHNGLAVLDHSQGEQRTAQERVNTTVVYRTLDEAEIERYLAIEQPLSCAGSLKSEALGSSLVECIQSDDPMAIIGLPLITLTRLLRGLGYALP